MKTIKPPKLRTFPKTIRRYIMRFIDYFMSFTERIGVKQ